MKKENESKIWGENAYKIIDWAKSRPVGFRIPPEQEPYWTEHKMQCAMAGIGISEGSVDMLIENVELNKTIWPLAISIGINPLELRKIMIEIIKDVINNLEKEQFKVDSEKMRSDIVNDFKHSLSVKLNPQ